MSGGAAIFLDSVDPGFGSQTAERQEGLAHEVKDAHGGADRFSAVATDSAESCIKMRATLAVNFPDRVPLRDQAHIANLVLEDILKNAMGISCPRECVPHRRLYPRPPNPAVHYRAKAIEFSKSKPDTARFAVQFAKSSTARFAL
jgi:hypothetical protein